MSRERGPRAFVLNFDAEVELATRGAYRPSQALERVLRGVRGVAARALLEPGDLLVDELLERGERLPPRLAGIEGDAWCPTPSARARLIAVGARPGPAPAAEVLRAANGRSFCARLGQELPGAGQCTTLEQVRELLRAAPDRTFLAKRELGAAGRARRPLRAADLSAQDRRWIEASLRGGPLQVEPRVAIEVEFGTHGQLGPSGDLVLGEPTVQEIGPDGTWERSRAPRADELDGAERGALLAEAERVGRALAALGYFGPFGVDAYRWRADGERHLCRRGEVNARYSMGWRTGMGSRRGPGIG